MQRRSGTRRTCPVGLAALFLAVLSTVAGCRDLPFRRLGPALAERPTAVAGHVSEAATSEASARVEVAHPQPRLPLEPAPPTVAPDTADPIEPIAESPPELGIPPAQPPVEPTLTARNDPDITLTASPSDPPTVAEEAVPTVSEPVAEVETCPIDSWADGLRHLRELARAQADRRDATAPTWDLRERLLTCLDESDVRGEPAELQRSILSVFGEPADPAPPAPSPTLEVVDLAFCHRVRGFGDFEPVEAADFLPGQTILIYCELTGLRYLPDGDRHRSRLTTVIEVVPESGDGHAWRQPLGTADDLCRRPRRDYYVNGRVTLPESLAPGTYQLRLIHTDASDGTTATRSLGFRVRRAEDPAREVR